MVWFKYSDYSSKKKTSDKPKKAHWEKQHRLPTQLKSDNVRWTMHCPRLCQQKSNGSKGKKTFDGKICNSCGYEKKDNPSFH
jgi:hypothetical protein